MLWQSFSWRVRCKLQRHGWRFPKTLWEHLWSLRKLGQKYVWRLLFVPTVWLRALWFLGYCHARPCDASWRLPFPNLFLLCLVLTCWLRSSRVASRMMTWTVNVYKLARNRRTSPNSIEKSGRAFYRPIRGRLSIATYSRVSRENIIIRINATKRKK